jgi:putative MATE family efflux protein
MKENRLGTQNITTLFFSYSIPAIAGMLFLGINTIIDGFFVGNYIGVNALASVNIAMPFFSLMIALGVIIGIGTQSLIGGSLGEGNKKAADDTFTTALYLITGTAFLLAAIAVVFTKEIAAFLGASGQLMPLVTTYITYTGLFLPFLGIMFVLDYVLKVQGKPLYSMLVLVMAVVTHMIFNYIFIVRLSLGIKGAALATAAGYGSAFVMAILPFITGRTVLQLTGGRFSPVLARRIFYNGMSEGLAEIGTGITTFLFNITLMRYAGEIGVAAFTTISYLQFIGNNMLLGLADGVGAIISYNYGSRQIERVKAVLRLAALSALLMGIAFFGVILVYSREIIALFLDASHGPVLAFAENGAKLYAFAFFANGLNIVAAGYFTAVCNPAQAVAIALSRGILWIGLGLSLLPNFWGISGIWLAVPIAEMLTLLLSAKLLYHHFRLPLPDK